MSIEPVENRGIRLGIVGGGQLGRMLWESATRDCGLDAIVLAQEVASPAEKAGARVEIGSTNDAETLLAFSRSVDRIILESEFISGTVLKRIQSSDQVQKWTPPLGPLMRLQSKFEQKVLLQSLDLATARFERPSAWTRATLAAQIPFVLKASHGGYDGKGVFIASSASDLSSALDRFLDEYPEPYLEEKIDYAFEAALVACRTHEGAIHYYPLVESRQKNGVCSEVLSLAPEVRHSLQSKAEGIAARLLEFLEWKGVLAIEFFVTRAGSLLVNELAPRVHNSAHFTQAASTRSQFEVHVRAACDLPLTSEDFKTMPSFVMLNLLGPRSRISEMPPLRLLAKGLPIPYDYEKFESRPGRKLGHWNYSASETLPRPQLEKILDEMRAEWDSFLQGSLK